METVENITFKCIIKEHDLLTPRLHRIILSKPKFFKHKAGQYLKLYLDEVNYRLYSIASAPHEDFIELHILEPNYNSKINSFLLKKVNEQLVISNGIGNTIDVTNLRGNLLLVAGGCGFAPIKSIIENIQNNKKNTPNIFLLWNIQSHDDSYYLDQLETIKIYNRWFNYSILFSNEEKESTKDKYSFLRCYLLRFFLDLKDYHIYVSGAKSMVREVYYHAINCGINKNNFYCDYEDICLNCV